MVNVALGVAGTGTLCVWCGAIEFGMKPARPQAVSCNMRPPRRLTARLACVGLRISICFNFKLLDIIFSCRRVDGGELLQVDTLTKQNNRILPRISLVVPSADTPVQQYDTEDYVRSSLCVK